MRAKRRFVGLFLVLSSSFFFFFLLLSNSLMRGDGFDVKREDVVKVVTVSAAPRELEMETEVAKTELRTEKMDAPAKRNLKTIHVPEIPYPDPLGLNESSLYFTGSREEVKEECDGYVAAFNPASSSIEGFASQYNQDGWLFHTMFSLFVKLNIKGTYLDLASSFPRHLSNSFLFDLCFGWKGLCIEGDPLKAAHFRKSIRSCDFEEVCITKVPGPRRFVSSDFSGENSIVASNKLNSTRGEIIDINCGPLSPILNKHKILHIDFASIDIEGFEFEALSTIDFSKVKIDIFVVERAIEGSDVHKLLEKNGFAPMGILGVRGFLSAIDYIFVRKNSIWYKYCKWTKGHLNVEEFEATMNFGGLDALKHPWPRNCNWKKIEKAIPERYKY